MADKTTANETNYTIKCTVSELTVQEIEETKISVKIVGSEGYAIKQGDKTYNVFCPENMPAIGKCDLGYIVDSETEFTVNKDFENILTQASMHGKKIRLTIELANEEELKKHIQDKSALPIKSVTLLQK